ncbi:MAG: ComEC/Rec2 family competence protein [Lachnospiraceae bacterium]
MRQKRMTKWLSGTLVAGMVAAAIITGQPEAQHAYNSMPVKKADFRLTEHITEGVEALNQGTVADTTGIDNAATAPTDSGQDSDNNTAAAGQGSKTITAGSAKKGGSGPTTLSSIVTEAEKGTQSEPILGGASITMLNSQTNSQILSVIIETSQGSLIVVDGGLGEDGDYLLSQIQARGGHVSAWFLTHPHGDHVGALYKILQDGAQGIQIDGIYYSMAEADWYRIHDPEEQTMAISLLGTFAGLPQDVLHQVSRNQFIEVDDVIIQVMNDRYELSEDKGNNAGIVYKMLINNKKVLFLGDLADAGGRKLLADCGAEQLQADIVQMAHHGQNGVSEEVYRAINPSICLWPTPSWMWDHDGSKWTILETKSWMSKLGDLKHYVMKDGDQVIY